MENRALRAWLGGSCLRDAGEECGGDGQVSNFRCSAVQSSVLFSSFLYCEINHLHCNCLFYLETQYLDTYNSSIFRTLLQWFRCCTFEILGTYITLLTSLHHQSATCRQNMQESPKPL